MKEIILKHISSDMGTVKIEAITELSLEEDLKDPATNLRLTLEPPPDLIGYYRRYIRKGEVLALFFGNELQGTFIIESITTHVGRGGGFVMEVDAYHPIKVLMEGRLDINYAKKFQTPSATLKQLIVDVVSRFFFGQKVSLNDSGLVESVTSLSTPIFEDDDAREGDERVAFSFISGFERSQWEKVKVAEVQAQFNETAYDFIVRQCTRHGLILRPASNGAVMLTRPCDAGQSAWVIGQSNDFDLTMDAIDTITEHDTNRDQFSSYSIKGCSTKIVTETVTAPPEIHMGIESEEGDGSFFGDFSDIFGGNEPVTNEIQKIVVDKTFANDIYYDNVYIPARSRYRPGTWYPYKPFFCKDSQASTMEKATNAIMLSVGLHAMSAYKLSMKLPDVADINGHNFTVNRLATVVVSTLGINEQFLVTRRTVHITRDAGQVTELDLIPKGAFVIGEVSS